MGVTHVTPVFEPKLKGRLTVFVAKTRIGQDVLVDLRNGLLFTRWDRSDGWEPIRLKSKNIIIKKNEPIQANDYLGLLGDLVVVDIEPFNGPHPGGAVRCKCGAHRDEDGECPRCDYGRCHKCKNALKNGVCSDETHNFMRIPPAPDWDKKQPIPIGVDEYQTWEKKPEKPKKGVKQNVPE